MNKPSKDLLILSQEVKEISNEIGKMKRKKNRMADGEEKEKLKDDIKKKQYQALFYVEKMGNISEHNK